MGEQRHHGAWGCEPEGASEPCVTRRPPAPGWPAPCPHAARGLGGVSVRAGRSLGTLTPQADGPAPHIRPRRRVARVSRWLQGPPSPDAWAGRAVAGIRRARNAGNGLQNSGAARCVRGRLRRLRVGGQGRPHGPVRRGPNGLRAVVQEPGFCCKRHIFLQVKNGAAPGQCAGFSHAPRTLAPPAPHSSAGIVPSSDRRFSTRAQRAPNHLGASFRVRVATIQEGFAWTRA